MQLSVLAVDRLAAPASQAFIERLFLVVRRFALCYRTAVCPVCDVGVLWPNGWMDQDETWHAGRSRPRPHCVRWRPTPPPQKGQSPQFSGPCPLWPNDWLDQDATWYGGSHGPGNIVLNGEGPSSPKRFTAPPIYGPVSIVVKQLDASGYHLVQR